MAYAIVMVNLDPGEVNAAVLQVGGDISERLYARVIGIAAGQLMISIDGDGYVVGSLINQSSGNLQALVVATETEFRHALQNRALSIECRAGATFSSLAMYVADESRCADLVVKSASTHPDRSVNTDGTDNADPRTRDVVAWLGRHGIAADTIIAKATGTDHHRLHELAAERKTGLIVAGIYDHSRVREWIFVGVTRALLDETASCSLLLHRG